MILCSGLMRVELTRFFFSILWGYALREARAEGKVTNGLQQVNLFRQPRGQGVRESRSPAVALFYAFLLYVGYLPFWVRAWREVSENWERAKGFSIVSTLAPEMDTERHERTAPALSCLPVSSS